MLRFLCILLLGTIASAGVVHFDYCGGTLGGHGNEIGNISLSQCDHEQCALQNGKDLHIEIVFIANQNTDRAEFAISGIATTNEIGNDIQLDVGDRNACRAGHLPCPLFKGHMYTLKYDIKIPGFDGAIAMLNFDISADNGNGLACGTVKFLVKKP